MHCKYQIVCVYASYGHGRDFIDFPLTSWSCWLTNFLLGSRVNFSTLRSSSKSRPRQGILIFLKLKTTKGTPCDT